MKIINRMFEIMDNNNIKSVDLSNYLNINKSVISNWKTRNTDPPAEYIVPICKLLKVSPYYLLTGKEDISNISEDEKSILEKYNILTERNKGKIEYIIDDLINSQSNQNGDSKNLA